MDASTVTGDTAGRSRLVVGLLGLVDEASRQGRSWQPSPAFDRAVTRWSRDAQTPLDVLVLVAEARRAVRPSATRDAVLEHLSLVAVAAVSERVVSAALTDPLTGLATRARLDDEVQHLLAASLRNGSPLTAVVMDVDGLKRINDGEGHAAGDAALAEVGRAVRATLRRVDRAFRVGGDEFALILPDTTAEAARSLVERIQRDCSTSFSVGLATHSGAHWDTDLVSWLQEADDAMYHQREQLRGLCTPGSRSRSTRARAMGLVLAAGLSVGAWAGIAMAVHSVVSEGSPSSSAAEGTTGGGRAAAPQAGGSGTVALPRGVNPRVIPVVGAARPTAQPVAGRPAAPQTPVVQVPHVPLPDVRVPPGQAAPAIPSAVEPSLPPSPPSASQSLLSSVVRVIGGLLKPVLS